MKNKEVRKELQMLYGLRCLLTNEKTRLSVHHIEKVEYGGNTNELNCVLLNRDIHDWLHNELEQNDRKMFELVNDCLDLYKKCIKLGLTDLVEEYENEIIPKTKERIKRK